MKGFVQTVLGTINPDLLGLTITHEHLHHDLPEKFFSNPLPTRIQHLQNAPITMENLGWIRQYPYSFLENGKFDDAVGDFVKDELKFFKKCGGGTIVDNGSIGLRAKNQHEFLKKLSEDTGVNIILGTGFFTNSTQSTSIRSASIEELAGKIREDIKIGVNGIKCGVIGEVGCFWPIEPFEKHSLAAAAVIQVETGAPVIIHPIIQRKAPEEIIRIFQEAGGDVKRLAMAHLDTGIFEKDELLEFAALGSFCEFDGFGCEVSHEQHSEDIDWPSDAQRIKLIKALVQEGYRDKILLSQDIQTKHGLMKYGGQGYSHILVNIIPRMLKRGLTEEDIHHFLHENPKMLLTFQ